MQQTSTPDPAPPGPPAFPDFVAARGRHLLKTAYLLTRGDSHLAEDLVQETLSRLYVRWGRISGLDNPASYAQTVLANTFLTYRRRRSSTERTTHEFPDMAVSDIDPTLRVALLQALAEAPPKDRAVLVLRFWEDRTVAQTAAALDMSEAAVRTRSHRALGRMRELLGSTLTEHDAAPAADRTAKPAAAPTTKAVLGHAH
ncbi:SigE family RNA polymerase sigma factor [Kitasatospora sp. NPDC002227]|uniref:SigE family RNA polymerase sigma factor n=1 Tax=Kitasatospora sp. NPDC002227 TaxID=3154773 RepID=UPI00331E3674